MFLTTKQLERRLLDLDKRSWRSLRATIRWRYAQGLLQPVGVLKGYIKEMPFDGREWESYAREIAKKRKALLQNKRIRVARESKARKENERRMYMRQYMKNYRDKNRSTV